MSQLGLSLAEMIGQDGRRGPEITGPAQQRSTMSRGQIIAGILADALSGAAGHPGQFAAMLGRQRENEREDAQWGRRLEQKEQIEAKYRQPDVSPMVRDAQAWQTMTPEQRNAYQQMKVAGAGDPDVFVTLPNGQVYAGPKSGLSQALMGRSQSPQAPVGRLTPINGGQTPPASGGFR